jgi:divalent metal cation (Fe/Co/Zn/Cd) transporter
VTGAPPTAVSFRDGEGGRIALVTITLPGDQPLPSAHRHAGVIEEAVRERCPSLGDVIVHTEPAEAAVREQPARPAAQRPPTSKAD